MPLRLVWRTALLVLLFSFAAEPNDWITFFPEGSMQTLNFQSLSGPISNPLMGWAPWAVIAESTQPHTLVYADLTWRDFEPQPGVYDFASFETKNQFTRWRKENKRVVFRFLCDRPGDQRHLDIPDWLYAATHGSGDWYDSDYGKGYSPDYSNPQMLEFHQKAIRALGERYGKDGFFAYIELGSLGHWGEWHINENAGIRPLPLAEIRDQYVMDYVQAFPNTQLLMRRPFAIANQLNLGIYNDMTGDLEATNEWLNWIAAGGMYDQTGEPDALLPMPEAWQIAPVGGEPAVDMGKDRFYGKDLNQTIHLLEQSHTTFIGPGSPFEEKYGGPLQRGIDLVLERIGYRLSIRQIKMPLRVGDEKKIRLDMIFENRGVAPMYYQWPTWLYIFDVDGGLAVSYLLDMDLRQFLPGSLYLVPLTIPIDQLNSGFYTVGFAILDPMTNQPAVKLAMPNRRGDLIQELGTFLIKRTRGLVPR